MNLEERVRAATRAAGDMVTEIRDLTPSAKPARPAVRRRVVLSRWRLWLAPLAAAAAVLAVALSLVLVRDNSSDRIGSSPSPTSTLPRYFVALGKPLFRPSEPGKVSIGGMLADDLVVGTTLTGKTLDTVRPPAGTTFMAVSGASDDRTFVVVTTTLPTIQHPNLTESLYELRLAPGSGKPGPLNRLPIGPFSAVEAVALSGSGEELAVTTTTGPGGRILAIYTLATGRLVHSWSAATVSEPLSAPYPVASQALSWIDSDQAIAFASPTTGRAAIEHGSEVIERSLRVSSPGHDLMADSQVIWSNPIECANYQVINANFNGDVARPLVSADGATVSCVVSVYQHTGKYLTYQLHWLTYPTSSQTPADTQPTADYVASGKVAEPTASDVEAVAVSYTLWSNTSGSTLLVEWYPTTEFSAVAFSQTGSQTGQNSGPSPTGSAPQAHFGVISGGKFTPLTVPSALTAANPAEIAW